MWIPRLNPAEADAMRAAGRAAAATLARIASMLRPGVRASDIDRLVREDTAARGARPSQLGYEGFTGAVCVSPNDVACHGVPTPSVVLRDGDIVSVDVTSELDGWHGDTCATFAVGAVSDEARHVMTVAERCRAAGIAAVRDGARLGDVGAAVDGVARAAGCSIVSQVGGHGIGRRMHQPPHVAHVGPAGRGRRLRAGMAITIEPIVCVGAPDVRLDDDGWTLRTADGRWAAQFEHTILVTRDGAEVLTELPSARVETAEAELERLTDG